MPEVSYSQVKTWRLCKAQHHYKYHQRLRSRRIRRPLTLGKLIHTGLEVDAKEQDPFDALQLELDALRGKIFAAEREQFAEIADTADVLLRSYFAYHKPLNYVPINGIYAEHKFKTRLSKSVVLKGKIDAVAEDDDGYFSVEHKTKKVIPSEEERWRDLQTILYDVAIESEFGLPISGHLWDYIRSKTPAVPKILKGGGVSERELDTLPLAYKRFCEANNLKVDKYTLNLIREKQSTWFVRVRSPVMKGVATILLDQFIKTAEEIKPTRDEMNIGLHCRMCEFAKMCQARLMGLDVSEIKEKEYETRPEDTDEDPSEGLDS